MWPHLLGLIVKEFLAVLKDKKSRVVLIGPPIIQVLVFGYAATYDLSHVPFAVYNEDPGPLSRDVVAAFHGSSNFQEVAQITHDEQIVPLIDRKEALMLLHIGPHFSRDLVLGRPALVQVIVDGRNSNTAALTLTYVRTIADRFNSQWGDRHGQFTPPARLDIRAWFNPNPESRWFIVPGIVALLTLLVTMLVTALSVAREREQGTFDQLLVTPLRPVEILLGKAIPGFLIGLVEASAIILVARWWFHVPLRGSVLTLYIGVALFLLAAVGVGLMISALATTQQQGLLGAFLFMVPAIILSGFATPLANMPSLVQHLTLINPMRYFMVVLRGVFLEDAPLELLLDQFWPMAIIGVFTLGAASWLFRHRMH